MTKFEILQHQSAIFLTKKYPDNWYDMDDEEQLDFISEHIYEDFDVGEEEEVIDKIVQSANYTEIFLKKHGIEVTN